MNKGLSKQVKPYIRPGMAPTLSVAMVSPTCDLGNKSANLDKFVGYAKDASAKGADIVVFPELSLTGYQLCEITEPTPIYDVAETIPGPSVDRLIAAAKSHNIYIIMGMYEADTERVGLLYNTAVFVGPEGLLGKCRKSHIESMCPIMHFELHMWGVGPGSNIPVWEIRQGWRIGIIICYDCWVPEVPRVAAVKGADSLIVLSATPRHFIDAWPSLLTVRALENQTGVAFCNLLGMEHGVDFAGGRMAVEANSEVIVPLEGTLDSDGMSVATFSAETLYEARKIFEVYRDRNPVAFEALVKPTEFAIDYIPYKLRKDEGQA